MYLYVWFYSGIVLSYNLLVVDFLPSFCFLDCLSFHESVFIFCSLYFIYENTENYFSIFYLFYLLFDIQ